MVADRDPVRRHSLGAVFRGAVVGGRCRCAGPGSPPGAGDSGGASSGKRSATGRAASPVAGAARVRGGRREGVTHLARRGSPCRIGCRQAATTGTTPGSSPRRSGPTRSTRCRTATTSPVPNGARHVAACSSTLPARTRPRRARPGRSEAVRGRGSRARRSGRRRGSAGMPAAARAMPASTTRGPAAGTRMLPGRRSRCTAPAPWIASSASASSTPSRRTPSTDSGPQRERTAASRGRRHVLRGSHGTSASTSASSTAATRGLRTRETMSTCSCRQARNQRSAANSPADHPDRDPFAVLAPGEVERPSRPHPEHVQTACRGPLSAGACRAPLPARGRGSGGAGCPDRPRPGVPVRSHPARERAARAGPAWESGRAQRDEDPAQRGEPAGRGWPCSTSVSSAQSGSSGGPGARSPRAVVDRGGQVVERGDDVVRRHVRQAERADARRVHHPAAAVGGQRQRQRRHGRVAALADAADPPTARSASGTSALTSVDLPTPECPTSAETRPASRASARRRPARRAGSRAPAAPARRMRGERSGIGEVGLGQAQQR